MHAPNLCLLNAYHVCSPLLLFIENGSSKEIYKIKLC